MGFDPVALIPLSFVVFGMFVLVEEYRFRQRAVRTTGQIVDARLHTTVKSDRDGVSVQTTSYPIVRFVDQTGQDRTAMATKNGRRPGAFQPGQQVDIFVDVNDPTQIRFASWARALGMGAFMIVLGTVFFVLALRR